MSLLVHCPASAQQNQNQLNRSLSEATEVLWWACDGEKCDASARAVCACTTTPERCCRQKFGLVRVRVRIQDSGNSGCALQYRNSFFFDVMNRFRFNVMKWIGIELGAVSLVWVWVWWCFVSSSFFQTLSKDGHPPTLPCLRSFSWFHFKLHASCLHAIISTQIDQSSMTVLQRLFQSSVSGPNVEVITLKDYLVWLETNNSSEFLGYLKQFTQELLVFEFWRFEIWNLKIVNCEKMQQVCCCDELKWVRGHCDWQLVHFWTVGRELWAVKRLNWTEHVESWNFNKLQWTLDTVPELYSCTR